MHSRPNEEAKLATSSDTYPDTGKHLSLKMALMFDTTKESADW